MGRKHSRNHLVVNPLQRSFGVYLRMRRNQLRITSQDIARSFGVNPTYYRLIESGQGKIGPGWIPDIIGIFSPRKVHVDFSSLAMLLSGIAILDKFWVHEMNPEDPFRELEVYPDFKKLLEAIRPYFGFEEDSKELQDFLETKAFKAMRDYLETSPAQRDEDNPHLTLNDVSPGGVEILRSLYRQLVGRRFLEE